MEVNFARLKYFGQSRFQKNFFKQELKLFPRIFFLKIRTVDCRNRRVKFAASVNNLFTAPSCLLLLSYHTNTMRTAHPCVLYPPRQLERARKPINDFPLSLSLSPDFFTQTRRSSRNSINVVAASVESV